MIKLNPVFKRDLIYSGQLLGSAGNTPLMFVLLIMLFPLALGAEAHALKSSAGGILILILAFTILLNIDGLFRQDWHDGTLDMIIMSGRSPGGYALAHMAAHWFRQALPLVVLAPFVAGSLGVPLAAWPVTALVLGLAAAIFILIGGVANALMLGAQGGAFLLAFVCLPLYIPSLIFAASSLQLTYRGLSPQMPLAMLGALFMAALVLAPVCLDKLLGWKNE